MRYQMKSGLAHGGSTSCRDGPKRLKSAGPPLPGKEAVQEHFKIAIRFHCGGLNLLPFIHKNVG